MYVFVIFPNLNKVELELEVGGKYFDFEQFYYVR